MDSIKDLEKIVLSYTNSACLDCSLYCGIVGKGPIAVDKEFLKGNFKISENIIRHREKEIAEIIGDLIDKYLVESKGTCFLGERNGILQCLIYPVRPKGCRKWSCDAYEIVERIPELNEIIKSAYLQIRRTYQEWDEEKREAWRFTNQFLLRLRYLVKNIQLSEEIYLKFFEHVFEKKTIKIEEIIEILGLKNDERTVGKIKATYFSVRVFYETTRNNLPFKLLEE